MAVPNIFGTATSAIPLSQLDTNFATPVTIGNTAVQLGNTVTSFGNVTLTNVTISSGNVTVTGANVSGTANVSTLIVTGNQTSLGNVAITGNISANIATFSAGSNTAPSITTTGDTNTGIFFPAADTIAFSEGGVESMRINSSGNVGIGTNSPTDTSSYGRALDIQSSTGAAVYLRDSDGPTTDYGLVAYDSSIDSLTLGSVTASTGIIRLIAAGNEAARIDSSGNLLVGATSQIGSGKLCIVSNTSIALKGATSNSSGNINFYRADNGNNAWAISTNGDNFYIADADFTNFAYLAQNPTAWLFASDRRIKTDIADIEYGLNAVMAMKPRKYKMISSGETNIGFIAQELQAVIPEAVAGEEIEYLDTDTHQEKAAKTMGVSKDTLIPVLVKAIQEQQALITQLQADVAALKGTA